MSESARSIPLPIPEPHQEKPPPNIPIPGMPTIGGEKERRYICEICGKEVQNKKELEEHMKTTHLKRRVKLRFS